MTEKLYRWVRCENRMPPKPAEGEWPVYDVRLRDGSTKNLAFYGDGFCIAKATGGGMVGGVIGSAEEWLEELPQPEPSGDEVERVARAISNAHEYWARAYGYDLGEEVCEDLAKAAIAAMDARTEVDVEAALGPIWEEYRTRTGAEDWIREHYCDSARKVLEIAIRVWGKQ